MLSYHLITRAQQKTSEWSGGTTTELSIYPPDRYYSERNFWVRISSATVLLETSDFTPLPGFTRHIMLVDGQMRLMHQGQHNIRLEQFSTDFFDGAWQTKSWGKCTDFNLMLAQGWRGRLTTLRAEQAEFYYPNRLAGFYCLAENCVISLLKDYQVITDIQLNHRDFLLIPPQPTVGEYQFQIHHANGAGKVQPLVVYANAWSLK